MSMPPKQVIDQVCVAIGGVEHRSWMNYEIDSDLLTPADAWRVRLALPVMALPPQVVEGTSVVVRMNDEVMLQGTLDERTLSVAAGQHELGLSGRDGAGILLDCSSPIFTRSQLTLDQVVANIVRPLGVGNIRIEAVDGNKKLLREKVNTEPGDCAWDSLRRAAEANGLWPWFEPDGTLVVGGPRYDVPPVATLVLRGDGVGNNMLSLAERRSVVERYSEVTVFGQAQSTGMGDGQKPQRHNIKGVEKDSGVKVYRPKIVVDHEAVNEAIAKARGRKIISDARVKGYTLTATVKGHRTADGVLWKPGQRVTIKSEPHGLDGIYFLMARRFTGDKHKGQHTQLTFKEDGMWVLDAHPSKRRHRRGKNGLGGVILDLPADGGTP